MLNLDRLVQNVSRFLEIKLEIYELKLKKQLAETIASIAALFLVAAFGFVALVFLSLALGFYLNVVFGSSFLGLLVVGGLYIVIGIIIFRFKDRLITQPLFESMFKETKNEVENEKPQSYEDEY